MMRSCAGVVLLAAGAALAQDPAPPPPRDAPLPEWRAVTSTASARSLFRPMEETPPVEWAPGGAVRLPVNFASTRAERVSWDLPVRADLRLSRGIAFDFFCRDLTPFSSFSLYFRSGGGWYHATFSPEASGQWQRIVVNKADTRTEGQPAGWGAIDTLRVSGWRARGADTVCALANLGLAGGRPMALVVRAESNVARAGGEAHAFGEYAAKLSSTFDALGMASAQVADTDLAEELLSGVKLVALPYNPRLPPQALPLLKSFSQRGGKVLACYTLPEGVDRLLGLKVTGGGAAEGGAFAGFARTAVGLAEQPAFAPQASWRTTQVEAREGVQARTLAVWRDNQGRDTAQPALTLTSSGAFMGHVWFGACSGEGLSLMRVLVGELVPELWRQSAEQAYAAIGALGPVTGFDELRAATGAAAPAAARKALAEAAAARDEARALMAEQRWSRSVASSARAADLAARAWFLTQPSQRGEQRAFWCHSAFGLEGKGWDASVKLLKESGFNTLLPNMLWGGTAYYPSRVLPEYAGFAEKGDQLAQCLAACKKYGVQCHVWKVDWNTGGKAPKAFLESMAAAGRTQKLFSGELKTEWLCPSHPDNRDLEVRALLEVVRNYEVDGVHFDYIRYPGSDACFCDGCRARFEAALGRPAAPWPQATRTDPATREQWLDFRRGHIDAVVQAVAEQARALRPGIRISAAVFRNWPVDRDGVGQDWRLWCQKGWLDFVCPMDYTDSNALFRSMVEAQKEYAGKVPLYPGIGLSCWKDPKDGAKLAQQIRAVREAGLAGYTVFNYDANAEAVLPLLKLGVTSEP